MRKKGLGAGREEHWWQKPGVDPDVRAWNERVYAEHDERLSRQRATKRAARDTSRRAAAKKRATRRAQPGGARCRLTVSWRKDDPRDREGYTVQEKRFTFSPRGWQAAVQAAKSASRRTGRPVEVNVFCEATKTRGGGILLASCSRGACTVEARNPMTYPGTKPLAGVKRRKAR